MNKWRKLSLEFNISAFGYRVEVDLVPFQLARPQFGLSPGMCGEQRLPSLKVGPLHIWTMLNERWEIGLGADLRAAFHGHTFSNVYPNSFVWPVYGPQKEETHDAA